MKLSGGLNGRNFTSSINDYFISANDYFFKTLIKGDEMTLNYNDLRKEFNEIKKKEERERVIKKTENDNYEERIKFQAQSTWNGIYSNKGE